MDPISALGLAANVAGLASLAKEALKLLGEYCIAVKDAPMDIKQLREEYAVLEHVLQQLENFLRQENAIGHSFAKTSVLYLNPGICWFEHASDKQTAFEGCPQCSATR